jgi:Photosynthetic reaction centre cytochrome C subunit
MDRAPKPIPRHKENTRMRHPGFLRFASALSAVSFGLVLVSGVPCWAGKKAPKKQAATQESAPAEQEKFALGNDNRPASEVYKNVQILKDVPASQLIEIMKYYTRALGVRCEHCHVTAPGSQIPGFGAFSKDDLEAKQTARKMIQMVRSIDKEFFSDKAGPRCWTCHRGSTKPEIEPAPPAEKPAEGEKKPAQ